MKILFLCVANSTRSQLAEGLARKILGPEAEIQSAGSEPSGKVNPFAIQAMKEIGIDISGHHSKSWDDLPPKFFIGLDYVITLCAEEICPTIAVKSKKLHWDLPDPAGQGSIDAERLEAFRKTREEIKRRLEEFKSVQ
ncbi:arsenate reductase ArsC [bacterium]|nr:arsenate reductase ArsC [bacterium]